MTDFARAVHIQDDRDQVRMPWKMQAQDTMHRIKIRYGLMLIGLFALAAYTMILCCVTGTIVHHNTWAEAEEEFAGRLAAYQAELQQQEQAQYWLSGEASLEAQIGHEATLLCKGDGIWKTDEALYGYWCSVLVRVSRPDYPDSVEEVLRQEGQYAFWNENAMVDESEHAKCVELLRQWHSGVMPAHLTLEHRFLEMRDDGRTCVLHTTYNGKGADDPWRWRA